MNWITTAASVLQLLPALIAAMKAIEDAIPGQGNGEAKLRAMREILESVSTQATSVWPILEKTIAILVGLFNKTGAFTK